MGEQKQKPVNKKETHNSFSKLATNSFNCSSLASCVYVCVCVCVSVSVCVWVRLGTFARACMQSSTECMGGSTREKNTVMTMTVWQHPPMGCVWGHWSRTSASRDATNTIKEGKRKKGQKRTVFRRSSSFNNGLDTSNALICPVYLAISSLYDDTGTWMMGDG